MDCANCKQTFKPKRKTAKYCSAKCRVYAGRDKPANLAASIEPYLIKRKERLEANVVENPFCEHTAGKGFCKKSKCKHSMFNPKNR